MSPQDTHGSLASSDPPGGSGCTSSKWGQVDSGWTANTLVCMYVCMSLLDHIIYMVLTWPLSSSCSSSSVISSFSLDGCFALACGRGWSLVACGCFASPCGSDCSVVACGRGCSALAWGWSVSTCGLDCSVFAWPRDSGCSTLIGYKQMNRIQTNISSQAILNVF